MRVRRDLAGTWRLPMCQASVEEVEIRGALTYQDLLGRCTEPR